jgi:hypothetical protein
MEPKSDVDVSKIAGPKIFITNKKVIGNQGGHWREKITPDVPQRS